MIKQEEVRRIWKRSIAALAIVNLVTLLILGSFLEQRINHSEGPSTLTIIVLFIALIIVSLIMYYICRFIRDVIVKRYGEVGDSN